MFASPCRSGDGNPSTFSLPDEEWKSARGEGSRCPQPPRTHVFSIRSHEALCLRGLSSVAKGRSGLLRFRQGGERQIDAAIHKRLAMIARQPLPLANKIILDGLALQ